MADIPLDPRLQAQLLDLYTMGNARIASTQPIHQAAMAMASRLAPGYARSAMGPVPQPSAPLTTGNLGQTGPSSTVGKVAAAAIAAMLADAAKNGGGGNIGKLIKDLIDHFRGNDPNKWTMKPGDGFGGPGTSTFGSRDPFGTNLPGFDTTGFDSFDNGWNGLPNDPSGGTGVGPGMQGYYDSGGGVADDPTGDE
jgi:hypothetical protein